MDKDTCKELRKELSEARLRCERARRQADQDIATIACMRSEADRLQGAIDCAEGEIKRLREALAPFAKAAEKIPDFGPHAKAIADILAVNWKDGSLPMFGTEFHHARKALEGS